MSETVPNQRFKMPWCNTRYASLVYLELIRRVTQLNYLNAITLSKLTEKMKSDTSFSMTFTICMNKVDFSIWFENISQNCYRILIVTW